LAAALSCHLTILFEFPTLNGGEHSMLAVLEHLSGIQEFTFTAIAPAEGPLADELHRIGTSIIPWCVRSADGARRPPAELAADLSQLLTDQHVDILHGNSLSMARFLGKVRDDLPNVQCTGHIRDIMSLSAKAIDDLNHLDGIVAVSAATRDAYTSRGLSAALATVIHNGVDVDFFRARSRSAARKELLPSLPLNCRVLLNVGQICLRKGQLDLAQAAVRLLQDRDDLHLVLVGERHSAKAESIAYEQAIIDAFVQNGLQNHLHRPGYCRNVAQWMNAADLLVHVARQEPLGRVLLEAAASELPIVATDVGGTSEIITSQESAWLVPPADVDTLTDCLTTALSQSDVARQHARRATERVRHSFLVPTAAEALMRFWKTLGTT